MKKTPPIIASEDEATPHPVHEKGTVRKQLLISFLILVFLICGTLVAVLYGRGYRFGFDGGGKPEFSSTGLFVATSKPDGAQVFVNDHLTTATDNTINLLPGEYDIKIVKDGYFPWQKKVKVQKEAVTKAGALLFPTTPKLESITALGVQNPVLDPSQTKIAFTVASQSAKKNGIYILDMTTRPVLTLQSNLTQLTDDTSDLFSTATLIWSPSGTELIAQIIDPTTEETTYYLLKASGFTPVPQDITETRATVEELWTAEKTEKERARTNSLKPALVKIMNTYVTPLAWSPDETKILYQASTSATLPLIINPRLIGIDTTFEDRNLKKGAVYVYDMKEDKNTKILDELPHVTDPYKPSVLTWFPDSEHLIYVNAKKIQIMESDGQNRTTIYAGPFIDGYVFPWANGSRIVMLTDLGNDTIPPNLYTIGLE